MEEGKDSLLGMVKTLQQPPRQRSSCQLPWQLPSQLQGAGTAECQSLVALAYL